MTIIAIAGWTLAVLMFGFTHAWYRIARKWKKQAVKNDQAYWQARNQRVDELIRADNAHDRIAKLEATIQVAMEGLADIAQKGKV